MLMQDKLDAKSGMQGLLPRIRSSSSTPNQDPRPLIAGATAHITGPRAKTAADILVEEGLHCPLQSNSQKRALPRYILFMQIKAKQPS